VLREVVTTRSFHNLKKFINMGTFHWVQGQSCPIRLTGNLGHHQPVLPPRCPSFLGTVFCLDWMPFISSSRTPCRWLCLGLYPPYMAVLMLCFAEISIFGVDRVSNPKPSRTILGAVSVLLVSKAGGRIPSQDPQGGQSQKTW